MRKLDMLCFVFASVALAVASPATAATRIHGINWYPMGPAPIVNAQTYPTSDRIDATGRATVIAVNPENTDDVYLGTATGGVWRSTDGGQTWKPFAEPSAAAAVGAAPLSIGSLVVADCNPVQCQTVYAGTGENSRRRDTYWGAGLLIGRWSGGEFPSFAWTLSGGTQFRFGSIVDLVFDPAGAPRRLIAAVSSGVTASASESTVTAPPPASGYGLFLSPDDGESWSAIAVEGSAGRRPTDLEMDPSDPQTLWAGFDGRGIFRSADGGGSWCPLNPGIVVPGCPASPGLPDVATGFDFVEIAVHRPSLANPAVLYAMFGNCPSPILDSCSPPIYRSADGGDTWSQVVATSRSAYSRYTHTLVAHPNDPDVFYFGGINLFRWNPAGGNFVEIGTRTTHPDHHDLVFPDPADPDRMFLVNDGGFYASSDGGECWTSGNDDLQITGFQSMTSSPKTARVIGGTQDNGTNLWPGTRVWQHLTDSDSASTVIDASGPTADRMYDVAYQVQPRRTEVGAICCDWPSILNPDLSSGDPVAFYPPITQSPSGLQQLYFGTDRLHRSGDAGASWEEVSPPAAVTPPFPDIQTTNVITAIAVAPSNQARVYVGHYDGRVARTDGACALPACWPGAASQIPLAAPVTRIAVHPTQPDVAWATFSGFGTGAHVFKTTDAGLSWVPKAAGLPSRLPVNTVHVEAGDPLRVWLGTDAGVYRSLDGGESWSKFSTGLPNVPVYEISLDEERGLAWAGTHGRGAFVLSQPMVSNYEGWVDGGIWDVPVYGTGFVPDQSCTMRLVRQNGTACAQGSVDAHGGDVRTDDSGQLVTSNGGFYIDRPVAWACLNGTCVGGTPIDACNEPGNPLTSVEVECGGITGIDLILGCPQQANPPSSVLGLNGTGEGSGGPAEECLPGVGSGGGGPVPAEAAVGPPPHLLHLTPTLQVGDGSTRSLCTVAVRYHAGDSNRALVERARDAINGSAACLGAGVTAEILGLGQELGPGIEDPAPEDPRLVLHGPTLTGSHLITSLSAAPGAADGICLNLDRLGNPLINQLEIVRLLFTTAPGGAAGGTLRVVEVTPLGRCDITVQLAPGDGPGAIAAKVAGAFQAPGIPGPHPRCPSRRNARDVSLHGDSVVAVAAVNLGVCLDDPGVGFLLDPEEVEHRHPVADAGGDRTLADSTVALDGGASTDPDSTPGTSDDIAVYEWSSVPPAGPAIPLGSGPQLVAPLAPGLHRIRLRVVDQAGLADLDEVLIHVAPGARLTARVHLNTAYGRSDGPQLSGVPEDGTSELRDLAIRLDHELTPRDLLTVQLASQARGASPVDAVRDDIELDWAVYEHRFSAATRLAAGRIPLPIALDNERREVGVEHPFFALPRSLYAATAPLPETADGLLAAHRIGPFAGGWSADFAAYAGGWDRLELTPDSHLAGTGRAEDALGVQGWLTTAAPGLRLGLGLHRFEARRGILQVSSGDTWTMAVLSAELDLPTWFVRGEALWADHPLRLANGAFPDAETRAGYLQLGVRPLPPLTLTVQLDRTELEPGAPSATVDLEHDLAVGASWAFRPEVVLKLELHDSEGYGDESRVFDLLAEPPTEGRYGLVGLAVSF